MRTALAAIALAASFAACGPAQAQRIVEAPLISGWGYASCTDFLQRADDANARAEVAQWALGYYSGLLSLDVEGAVPAFRGLDRWLRANGANGGDVAAPVAARLIAQCRSEPNLKIEVASQRVAMALGAEAAAAGGAK